MTAAVPAGRHHDLTSLRTLASTGSPLSPERFAWVYERVKADLHLASISGGTDLCGCFVLGDPTSPVYAGEIQRPGSAWRSTCGPRTVGRSPPGERGELVCTEPFPSQPLGFWGDPTATSATGPRTTSGTRTPPAATACGTTATSPRWTDHGGIVIHGRSDTTLNPGGIRIGTAEIYRVVEGIDGIAESLVFGQEVETAARRAHRAARRGARRRRRSSTTTCVRASPTPSVAGCSPRHVPRRIVAVDDLPRTRSGKLVELAVADVVNGREVRNVEALANPDALWAIRDHPDALPGLRLDTGAKTGCAPAAQDGGGAKDPQVRAAYESTVAEATATWRAANACSARAMMSAQMRACLWSAPWSAQTADVSERILAAASTRARVPSTVGPVRQRTLAVVPATSAASAQAWMHSDRSSGSVSERQASAHVVAAMTASCSASMATASAAWSTPRVVGAWLRASGRRHSWVFS